MKIYLFYDFAVHQIINISHVLPEYNKGYTVTPQFYFRKGMPDTNKMLQI